MYKALIQQFHDTIWNSDTASLPVWKQSLWRFVQILQVVIKDISGGMLTLRAMSLVYTTLLSFVPLLAVSFSVLKGFGVHNQIEPMLLNLLEPLGEKSIEITEKIVGFVSNMKIGVLGALGLGVLIYTVISLIQKIESAFNYTWRLSTARNFSQRFSNYLSVIMVGPVLVFSAMGISASLKSQSIIDAIHTLPYGGEVIELVGRLIPYLLIIAAFTLVYLLVPNTRVKVNSALYGAIVAGLLWRWTGALFASFASVSTSYTAIYSSFAILLLFMIWLYLGWLILLIGASIAYYHQHPESRRQQSSLVSLSAELRENLVLQIMLEIGREHDDASHSGPTVTQLTKRLQLPQVMINRMLGSLLEAGMIERLTDKDDRFLPQRSIDQILLIDIWRASRRAEDCGMLGQLQSAASVRQLQQDLDYCMQSQLGEKTLKDLINSET